MNICNVITTISGVIDEVKSFNCETFSESAKKAEEYFVDQIIKLDSINQEDLEYFLDEGYYIKGNKEITIIWSS